MGSQSKIQWTDATWSPVRGCSMVSPGCTNCYAMAQAHRWPQFGKLTRPGPRGMVWTGEVRTIDALLPIPLGWREPRLVFVNSQSDTFHEDVPDDFIDRMFAVMALCPQHVFQVLTKRPERMLSYFTQDGGFGRWGYIEGRAKQMYRNLYRRPFPEGKTLAGAAPLKNIWLGVSVENQDTADERIPLLLRTPAAVRFLSMEPLLAPVDLTRIRHQIAASSFKIDTCLVGDDGFGLNAPKNAIGWVICGGESGHRARELDIAWIRSIVEQCQDARVPVFVKQLGAKPYETHPEDPSRRRFRFPRSRKGDDELEWPEDIRVRQFPEVSDEQVEQEVG